jgi:hypothetical protein
MKRGSKSKLAKARQSLAFAILKAYFNESIMTFCDLQGRCWLVVGDTKKRISTEEYYLFKEVGL